jgi:hypothetical protein
MSELLDRSRRSGARVVRHRPGEVEVRGESPVDAVLAVEIVEADIRRSVRRRRADAVDTTVATAPSTTTSDAGVDALAVAAAVLAVLAGATGALLLVGAVAW